MLLLPYLYDRQIGSIRKAQPFSSDCKPNLDCLLSRLVCCEKDVFITSGQDTTPVPPFSCQFRKDKESDLLAVSTEEGDIYLIDTERGRGIVKTFSAHQNAVFDICWLPDKNRLITGAGDFRSHLIDMNTCQLVSMYSFHSASIKSVDVCKTDNGMVFAAGSRDGNISVWDIRESCLSLHFKPSILIKNAHGRLKNNNKGSQFLNPSNTALSNVSAVAFKDCYNLASAGVADGVIKIWDLRKTYINKGDRQHHPRYQIKFGNTKTKRLGFTSLVFDSTYTKLYACSTADKIYQLDCHSYSKNSTQYMGFKCATYFVKIALSSDDQYILCGSSDNKAYIWKTSKPGLPIYELCGHSAEVTAVTWGAYNNTKVVTTGDDNKVLIWKTKNLENTNHNKEVVAEVYPYYKDDTDLPPNDQTISIFQSVTLVTPTKTTSTPKSQVSSTPRNITNFFLPLTPSPSATNTSSSLGNTVPPYPNTPTTASLEVGSLIPLLPLSPRKGENSADTTSIASVTQKQGDAASSPQKKSSYGKENGTVGIATGAAESGARQNGQLKRKLDLKDKFCKYHPEGCGRTHGHTRCGKKITIVPVKENIKKYFSVSPE